MNTSIPQNLTQGKLPSTPGIYAIVNTVNQHFYVGSAVNLTQRKHQHFSLLRKGKHHSNYLQRAYNRYGSDMFVFFVIEYVEHAEKLISREQHYIDLLKPEYNIARTAGSRLGVEATPETRAKTSASLLGRKRPPDVVAKISFARLGKKLDPSIGAKSSATKRAKRLANPTVITLSDATKAKMSAAHLGKEHTPETKAKMSATRLGVKKSPESIAKRTATRATNRAAKLTQQQANQPPLF